MKLNRRNHSHLERLRDRPDETSATFKFIVLNKIEKVPIPTLCFYIMKDERGVVHLL